MDRYGHQVNHGEHLYSSLISKTTRYLNLFAKKPRVFQVPLDTTREIRSIPVWSGIISNIIRFWLLIFTANHKLLRPFCYEKHMHFLDATEFNRTNPIYINMVRHPLDRILSWYYYARSPQYIYAEHSPTDIPDLKMMKRTFEECVINKSNDCIYPIGQYYLFSLCF